MSEYEIIDTKEIWLVTKYYFAGNVEFIGAYWDKDKAQSVAMQNQSTDFAKRFSIHISSVMLHGSMIDKVTND